MTLYFTGSTAIEYWRNCVPNTGRRTRAALPFGSDHPLAIPQRNEASLTALKAAGMNWLSEPIHLLVTEASARWRSENIVFHVCSHPLPEGSFIRLSQNVMVASAEFACLTYAPMEQFPLFVELLYELCGYYRLPHGRGGGTIERPPVTSVSSLRSFAAKTQSIRGSATLKRAAHYTCDNSLSPMETDIAETLLFDSRMGGWGIAKPHLNPRFAVSKKDRRVLPQSAYVPDLYWPQANISIEYESDKYHHDREKLARDAIRRNGIEHLGTRVITLTWEQARNYYEFERVALLVASALGKRFSPQWDTWSDRRIELHRLLVQR